MSIFTDGLTNIVNSVFNRRNAHNTNELTAHRVHETELRAIYRSGLGSKIVRLKSGHALNGTLQFENDQDEQFYEARLAKVVKDAAKYMIGFGRGIVVLAERGEDLSKPKTGAFDPSRMIIKVFSGDMVTATNPSQDLLSERYYKPTLYTVRGESFHHTRVVDFTYFEPPEFDKPVYQYGGISEFELIYGQLVNDAIVERASPAILEKNSTLFYKVKGFKEAMQAKQEKPMVNYFQRLEDARSVYGAGLLDSEDDAYTVDQTLTNLADVDTITLRRLAMVTGIPLALLVGENVKGLNSSGKEERAAFQDMIEALQSDYLSDPIRQLLSKLGLGEASFKENQGRTPDERIEFETKAINNALILWQVGEDYSAYLEQYDIIQEDPMDRFFGDEPGEDSDGA